MRLNIFYTEVVKLVCTRKLQSAKTDKYSTREYEE